MCLFWGQESSPNVKRKCNSFSLKINDKETSCIHLPLIIPADNRDILENTGIIPVSQHALGKNTLGGLLYSSL